MCLELCVVVVEQTSVTAHDLIKINKIWLHRIALRSGAAHLAVDLSTYVPLPLNCLNSDISYSFVSVMKKQSFKILRQHWFKNNLVVNDDFNQMI